MRRQAATQLKDTGGRGSYLGQFQEFVLCAASLESQSAKKKQQQRNVPVSRSDSNYVRSLQLLHHAVTPAPVASSLYPPTFPHLAVFLIARSLVVHAQGSAVKTHARLRSEVNAAFK